MKKFVFVGLLFIFGIAIYAQAPSVVVSDFTSRARDVHEDDLVTVMEMFMENLATGRTVNVIDRTILEKAKASIEFGIGDWANNEKTTKLGEELKADYIVSGAMTQLGTSLTFTISVRDIKTLAVVASDQKQYTTADVWDNSTGIPGQLSNMASVIASGISTEQNKRQQVIQTRLAQEQEQKNKEEADQKIGQMLVGTWYWTVGSYVPDTPRTSIVDDKPLYREIQFNSNGTFSLHKEYWTNANSSRGTGYRNTDDYSGSYTREGNTLRLSWSKDSEYINFRGQERNSDRYITQTGNSSSSGSGTITINIGGNELSISGISEFSGRYRRR